MARMANNRAKVHLQQLLDEIVELRKQDRDSVQFMQWERTAQATITRIFGAGSSRAIDFEQIYFSPMSFNQFDTPSERFNEQAQAYWDGLNVAQASLNSMIHEVENLWDENDSTTVDPIGAIGDGPVGTDKVFVVHGRDAGTRALVSGFLTRIGLDPIILQDQPNRGRTIIEKFEDFSNVGFAVVLCTPDDVGSLASEDDLRPRPRQNVILEWGFFLGKIGRHRVVALLHEDVEIPSDYDGVIYIPIDEAEGWKLKLFREMNSAGLRVDASEL